MRLYQVDAFTDKPFAGNPAAVCLLDAWRDGRWLQQVAAEMNLSETAFLVRRDEGFDLRWFTPRVEVDLCGHATLASAHILWEHGSLGRDETAVFQTKSGLLKARLDGEWIELDFPAILEREHPAPEGLAKALGVSTNYVGLGKFDYLVEVESEETLRGLAPDHGLLRSLGVRGVIVTARGREYDFVSRFFAPGVGIDEDPVTGSAHCCLGPYWRKRLGKDEFLAYQASARGGILKVKVAGDRVRIVGRAVTVFEGELLAGRVTRPTL